MRRISSRSFVFGVLGGLVLALLIGGGWNRSPYSSNPAERAGSQDLFVTSNMDGTIAYLWWRDPSRPLQLQYLGWAQAQ